MTEPIVDPGPKPSLWQRVVAPLANEAILLVLAVGAGLDRVLEWVANEQQWSWLSNDWRIAVIAFVGAVVARARVYAAATVARITERLRRNG